LAKGILVKCLSANVCQSNVYQPKVGEAAIHRSGNSSQRQFIEAAIHRSGNSSKRQFIKAAIHQSGNSSNGFFIECTNSCNFQNLRYFSGYVTLKKEFKINAFLGNSFYRQIISW
jgi:hypothetical protein